MSTSSSLDALDFTPVIGCDFPSCRRDAQVALRFQCPCGDNPESETLLLCLPCQRHLRSRTGTCRVCRSIVPLNEAVKQVTPL